MKLPLIHKFYSVNILIYLVIIRAISTFLFYLPFWNSKFFFNHFECFLWIACIIGIIVVVSELSVYMASIALPIELILYKLKKITNNNVVNVPYKIQIIVGILAIISLAYNAWFDIYYFPILDEQLRFD